MKRLEPLVGRWDLSLDFAGAQGTMGWATFEWELGGRFLLQRSGADLPEAPTGLSLIGPAIDGEGYTQHYFDSRGVVRLYAMTFEEGIWTLARESPDFSDFNFAQRFVGELSADGNRIDGRWEIAHDLETYELDFSGTYTRVT